MLNIPLIETFLCSYLQPVAFDGLDDRLNYLFTTLILLFFAMITSAKQCKLYFMYFGSAIQCIVPTNFSPGWEQYVEEYCFVRNTYYVPIDQQIPSESERVKAEIGYYQWVPIMLVLQAIMFYLPCRFWVLLHKYGGIDLNMIMKYAEKINSALSNDERENALVRMFTHLQECFGVVEMPRPSSLLVRLRLGRSRIFMSNLYIFIKFIYLVNIIVQVYILNQFLGFGNVFWGFQPLMDMMGGREWGNSNAFPRATQCDLKIRRTGHLENQSVQCVLMINMINEKIYLFLWLWFTIIAALNTLGFSLATLDIFCGPIREHITSQWLEKIVVNPNNYGSDRSRIGGDIKKFCHKALGLDGVLTLRFIETHAGTVVVKDIAARLFDEYMKQPSLDSTKSAVNHTA